MNDIEENITPSDARTRFRRGVSAALFALLLAAVAGWAATAGLHWSSRFHPDEPTIARWMHQTAKYAYILDRAYPSGWFALHRFHGCGIGYEDESEDEPENVVFDSVPAEAEESEDLVDEPPPKPKAGAFRRAFARHSIQDGQVNAVRRRTFYPRPFDAFEGPSEDDIQDARDFNAWLYVFSALFLFLACLESGMRPSCAFVSGLFFCASAGPLEFAHYCETDMGLVVSLSFFAWISSRALRCGTAGPLLACGLAAGFAAACKFTLAPLALWCIVLPFAAEWRAGAVRPVRVRILRAVSLSFASLALAGVGYAAGTPALVADGAWYAESLRLAKEGTYAEIIANLGGTYSAIGAIGIRAGHLVRHVARLGVLPLAWGAFAWTFWLRAPFRRQFAGVPLFLPFFLPFAALGLPFVRFQETLPVSILLALGAGLPLEWWLRRSAQSPAPERRLRLAARVCAVLAVAALLSGASRAVEMASCFQARDNRVGVQNWLRSAVPTGTRVGFDRYVGQTARDVRCVPVPRPSMAWMPRSLRGKGFPLYYVENIGFEGRLPIRDRFTGRLVPEAIANRKAWRRDTFEIARWSLPAGIERPTFGQPDVRLVTTLLPDPAAKDVPISFPRPILPSAGGGSIYDYSEAEGLGAFRALSVIGRRGTLRVAPGTGHAAVVRMLDGPGAARVEAEGPIHPSSAILHEGAAAAMEWSPGFLRRILSFRRAYPGARIRMRGNDQVQRLVAFFAPPADVARELREGGDPAAALAFLESRGVPDRACGVEAFLCCRVLSREPRPEWVDVARSAADAIRALVAETAAGGDGSGFLLRGVPLRVAEDFSRLRTLQVALWPGWEIPVWLPPGRYRVSFVPPRDRTSDTLPPRIFEGQVGAFEASVEPSGRLRLSCEVEMGRAGFPKFVDEEFEPLATIVEIAWDPVLFVAAAAAPLLDAFPVGIPESSKKSLSFRDGAGSSPD